MSIEIHKLIGEATAYDKKEMFERNKPKSWLKSVSAFANGEGGVLVFGITDDDEIVGLANAEEDAECISEAIKTKPDPIPVIDLQFREVDRKKLIVLCVMSGQETPYYYIGDKQRLAFVRIGNESVVADRVQLKSLVMKGSGRTLDGLPSSYRFEDMAFSKLRSVHYKRLQRSFEDSEFASWGIIDENGKLTNAGALLADESPMRQSRIFCTRWNGLDMTSGLGEAIDDVELEGCVIGQPDYPERAVTEAIANAIIHRDYMQMGSEIHVDMYDDRLEVYSPGGMMDGSVIQELNPMTVPSKRRNPLLADFFNRLGLMERRGSGMKKIINAYKQYEHLTDYRSPEFTSNASEFHVVLWNLNHVSVEKIDNTQIEKFTKAPEEFTKAPEEFTKEFTKEFVKASRQIYKLISQNSHINVDQMSESIGLSSRQIKKYMRRLQDLKKIARIGGRKAGEWKIIDEEYEGFFDRI